MNRHSFRGASGLFAGAATRLRLCRIVGTLGAALAVALLVGSLPLAAAHADTKVKAPAERTLDGAVQAKGGAPLPHAVVYLQDSKTMVIRSYVADDTGHYHFHQLSPDTDYDVWAEVNGRRSKTRTISQFNSHNKFHFTFKLKS